MNRVGKKQRERARKQRRAERKAAAARAGRSFAQAAAKAPSVAAPVCGGAAEQIDATRIWHIARTRPKMGDRTLKALGDIDVAKFVPRLSEVVVRHRRRVVRSTPLLMRTVFIGLRHPADLDAVRAQPGIAEIVSHPESEGGPEGNIVIQVLRPARLDPVELQRLADALAADEVVHPLGITVGQSVIVTDGPFASFPAGVEAILPSECPEDPEAIRLKLGISLFGRSQPLVIDVAQVALR